MRIYLTHCCAKKDDSLQDTRRKVLPDELYTALPTVRFMAKCRAKRVPWAILSDYYGVWFSDVRREWYGDDVGDPRHLTPERFQWLVTDLDTALGRYSEILFYHNPGRFHPVYQRLLHATALRQRVRLITHLDEIVYGLARNR